MGATGGTFVNQESYSHHVEFKLRFLQTANDVLQIVVTEFSTHVRKEDESFTAEPTLAPVIQREIMITKVKL